MNQMSVRNDGKVSKRGVRILIKESMASSPSIKPYEMVLDIVKMAHSNNALTEIDQPGKDEALVLIDKTKATNQYADARWVAKQLNARSPVERKEGMSAEEQIDQCLELVSFQNYCRLLCCTPHTRLCYFATICW